MSGTESGKVQKVQVQLPLQMSHPIYAIEKKDLLFHKSSRPCTNQQDREFIFCRHKYAILFSVRKIKSSSLNFHMPSGLIEQ
jgi:hypothetical protein